MPQKFSSLIIVFVGISALLSGPQKATAQELVLNAQTAEMQAVLSQSQPDGDSLGSSGTGDRPDEYFTISDDARTILTKFASPTELFAQATTVAPGRPGPLPLTRWLLHNNAPQLPTQKYVRKFHFGTWVNDPTDDSCLNTRAKVLVRDSLRPVTYRPNNHCVVDSGLWNDPYTGRQFTSTKDIQIDHVVPLKHAYVTGAFRWNYQARCLYGNFLENNYHLIPVNGRENMAKGDRSPDQYMPPNPKIACGYLQRWLEIKLAWGLVIFPNEANAIKGYIQKYRCNPAQFAMDRNELIRQRQSMSQILPSCMKTPTPPVQ